MGIKVKIMLPHDPKGQMGPRNPLPDFIEIKEPTDSPNPVTPYSEHKEPVQIPPPMQSIPPY